jgi:selenide,water dikinase
VPVKPIRRFNERWLALLDRVRDHAGATTIAVVGAGAGGVELTAGDAIPPAQRAHAALGRAGRTALPPVFRRARILPTHNAAVRRAFEGVLAERGVTVHCTPR